MTGTPQDAVAAWWQAMRDRDPEALARLAVPEFLSSGGPSGRTVGLAGLLAEAAAFFAQARIDTWSVDDLVVRPYGPTAVCSYRWSESGSHLGVPFAMRGLATDVLVHRDGRWRHVAHHVSALPADDGAGR
ncbi:nuclear transport factor 2 family protein [Nonomuraea sp. MCN248]|uniref:Nuclear transport factor 2 family protein n=1 Tax=Nonomuraea corallina TaxID=2989783 RepID=A0ABT4SMP8_9ACTN|nr:nuclear transport factor 2 family protein [Nonomuraea corallina]MDA0638280.1 nuclear transport factor 2 family protein [Nonomuraea corallina]